MLRNVDKRLKSVNEPRRESLRSDILIIQLARDRDILRKAVELYQTKHRAIGDESVNSILDYFVKEWVETLPGWYEGYIPSIFCIPSQNNGLESTNRRIKEDDLQYTRLPFGEFLKRVDNIVNKWSELRDPSSTKKISTKNQWSVQRNSPRPRNG